MVEQPEPHSIIEQVDRAADKVIDSEPEQQWERDRVDIMQKNQRSKKKRKMIGTIRLVRPDRSEESSSSDSKAQIVQKIQIGLKEIRAHSLTSHHTAGAVVTVFSVHSGSVRYYTLSIFAAIDHGPGG